MLLVCHSAVVEDEWVKPTSWKNVQNMCASTNVLGEHEQTGGGLVCQNSPVFRLICCSQEGVQGVGLNGSGLAVAKHL